MAAPLRCMAGAKTLLSTLVQQDKVKLLTGTIGQQMNWQVRSLAGGFGAPEPPARQVPGSVYDRGGMGFLQLPVGPARIFHIADARRHGNGTERSLHGVASPVLDEHYKPLRDHAPASGVCLRCLFVGYAVSSAVVCVVFSVGAQHLGSHSLASSYSVILSAVEATPAAVASQFTAATFSGLKTTRIPSKDLEGMSGAARNPRLVLMQAYAVAGSPAMMSAGSSPTLADSRKQGQRTSIPGWAVLRQARGCPTRELPAGHLGTFLRRRLPRMRYTASCVQT